MAYPTRKRANEEIESAKSSEGLKEFFRRESLPREDRVLIRWIIVMMAVVFLMLVLLKIRVLSDMPKPTHPTESSFY
jgi:hypothetical protein